MSGRRATGLTGADRKLMIGDGGLGGSVEPEPGAGRRPAARGQRASGGAGSADASGYTVMLELDGVVKHYRGASEEVRAVDGVSLAVAAGGDRRPARPSGSGKTTLLLLIAALLAPERARSASRARPRLALWGESDYRWREVGFIYQTRRLMPRVSALENAAIKLCSAGSGRARPGLRDAVAGAPRPRRACAVTPPSSSPAASASAWRSRARSPASRS